MSTIRADDIAYVRFSAPDLEVMRSFLRDFGLVEVTGPDGELFVRGAGSAPFLHATRIGEPGFAALGLKLNRLADLERLAASEGAAIEALNAPGGGQVVRLADPDGHVVEAVAGQTPAEPLDAGQTSPWNSQRQRERVRATKRVDRGPAQVCRLGHAVLNVSDFRASEAWYKDRFGFITSDEIAVNPDLSVGAFLRCDRGEAPTDHHTLFLLQAPTGPGFNHAAFEVRDLDDLMGGHSHLAAAERTPAWGVGRHILGSQVFDYWRDPYGHTLEHWTDGDLFTADDPSQVASLADLMGVQWGPAMPPHFG
jgi:catechol 2,3-dioxygenase-like lactoylglutathione lyase family enzyme